MYLIGLPSSLFMFLLLLIGFCRGNLSGWLWFLAVFFSGFGVISAAIFVIEDTIERCTEGIIDTIKNAAADKKI